LLGNRGHDVWFSVRHDLLLQPMRAYMI
jgi:hypothetical protein